MVGKLKLAENVSCKSALKIDSFKVEIATYKIIWCFLTFCHSLGENIHWIKFLIFLSDDTFYIETVGWY